MDVVLSAPALAGPGGVQSYVLTVAPQLDRLGHEVWLHAPVHGEMAEEARRAGFRVTQHEDELPERCDALVASDAPTLLELAARFGTARRAIVVHGAELDVHLPPQLAGVAHLSIALNDAVARRLAATATATPVVRLRQPIDVYRYNETEQRATPRKVLLLGNYVEGPRLAAFTRTCEQAGVEWRQIGAHGRAERNPVSALWEADVVVGVGRTVIEAMACGRAAWVFSGTAGDGWVTPERYAAMEGDGFRGRATQRLVVPEDFGTDLAAYDPEMGRRNRSLVLLHHRAEEHAIALVDALGAVEPTPPPEGALREMARLVRTRYDAEVRAMQLRRDLNHERAVTERLNGELAGERERLERIVGSRRWRLARALGRPGELARRRRRRAPGP